MKIHLGPLEISFEIAGEENSAFKVKEVTIRYIGETAETVVDAPIVRTPTRPQAKDYANELELLHTTGFSDKTLVMIANNVLGIQARQDALTRNFAALEEGSKKWLKRKLSDQIWAVYCSHVALPGHDTQVMAMGLNDKNQLIILGVANSTAEVLKDIVDRGVDPKKITVGILSFHLDAEEEFKKIFPKAALQLDWQEYIDMAMGLTRKEQLKEARSAKNKDEVIGMVKKLDGPKELITYLQFPEKLHRALQTTTPIKRLEKDVNHKARKPGIEASQREFITNWSILRLQYQWLKVPVDSNQLSNLKYIKSQADTDSF